MPESEVVYPLLGRPQDSLLPLRDNDGYDGMVPWISSDTDSKIYRYNVSFPTYMGANYDASTTNLTYLIPGTSSQDPLELVLSFLSPITPTSTLRQAVPASYLTVHVSGTFNVDVYIDVNGQWVSGDRGARIVWDLDHAAFEDSEKGLKTWKIKRETEQLLTENRDRSEWGTLHFSAPSVSASASAQGVSLIVSGRTA